VDLPDDLVNLEAETSRASREEEVPFTQQHRNDAPADANATNVQALLESQAALISALQAQVQAQQEELAAKNQQISQLHVLLQQAQTALSAPREDHQPWWRRLWHRQTWGRNRAILSWWDFFFNGRGIRQVMKNNALEEILWRERRLFTSRATCSSLAQAANRGDIWLLDNRLALLTPSAKESLME
jgi:hypothetical protein